MKRREFVRLLGGAAAWPLTARAQQPAKLPTIGVLGSGTAAAQAQWTAAFMQRLNELGWTEGRNVAIEYRWGEGRSERFGEIAAQFVRLKVDVILTHNTPPVLAVKQATAVIPIVFATSGDPLASGSLWLIEVAVPVPQYRKGGYADFLFLGRVLLGRIYSRVVERRQQGRAEKRLTEPAAGPVRGTGH